PRGDGLRSRRDLAGGRRRRPGRRGNARPRLGGAGHDRRRRPRRRVRCGPARGGGLVFPGPSFAGLGVALAGRVLFLLDSIKILPEYERGVVFCLGRLRPADYGPGIFFLIPVVDRMVRISLRTVVHDVPPQDIITRDNVSVKVNAVVYYRVMNPRRAVVDVENFHYATSQLSQTTLRSVLGQVELDELLSEREKLNQQLQTILDKHTDPWGIKVSAVEVKHVDLPA